MFGCGPGKPCSTPFGGPASGLWPSGAGPGIATPACRAADLLAQCFQGCDALGNCGWSILTPAGTVVFGSDHVSLGHSGANVDGSIEKGAVIPAMDFTLQFQFTEIAIPPNDKIAYNVSAFDSLGDIRLGIDLTGDGILTAYTNASDWNGAWTPLSGAVHEVTLSVDALGAVLLFIDGIQVALVPDVPAGTTGNPDTVFALIENKNPSGQGSFERIFVASGVLPASTVFCCP